MLNRLRRLIGLSAPQSDPVLVQLTIEEIDSQIRGLRMMCDLREEHGNWRGARICANEIRRLEEERATLIEPPITW